VIAGDRHISALRGDRQQLLEANSQLLTESRSKGERVATTFAGVVLCGEHLCLGHVGDSRAYAFSPGTGVLTQLATDHTVFGEALRRGAPKALAAAFTNAQALTRALGVRPLVDLRPVVLPWNSGAVLLLCTDGLSDTLDADTIAAKLLECDDLDSAASRLVDAALAAGSRDNVTVVLGRPGWRRGLPLVG
jgi:protein phosphatase